MVGQEQGPIKKAPVRPVPFRSPRGQALGHFREPRPHCPAPHKSMVGEYWGLTLSDTAIKTNFKNLEFPISCTLKLRILGPPESTSNLIMSCFPFLGLRQKHCWVFLMGFPGAQPPSCLLLLTPLSRTRLWISVLFRNSSEA